MFANKQIIELKSQITKLKQEKEQLRLFLHEIIEAYYRTVNQTNPQEKEEKDE
jgi:septal ring factor EnvC (AmiA/AmiB activator)